ncbi:MAG: hypothetical protein AAFM91_06335 [Pseudomonadota bacterium]
MTAVRCSAFVAGLLAAAAACAATDVLVVEGLGGEARYADAFALEAEAVAAAAATLPGDVRITRLRGADANREAVAAYFADLSAPDLLLVYLIGHGSFNDIDFKFNIPGPDFTDTELATWLDDTTGGTQLVVLTGSASGAASDTLANDRRIIITATRSGVERHATRFGEFFAAALSDPSADLDKNRRITAREAFDYAARAVADTFKEAQQLATEHALLAGQRADRLTLARIDETPTAPADDDPELARLTAERDRLNAEIEALQLARERLSVDEYRDTFTRLLIELAQTEEAIDERANR